MSIRWRIATISLAAILVGGVILAALLALGLADPPRAGALQWQAASPEDWLQEKMTADLYLLRAPQALPRTFTLELSARNDGPPGSAWGIRLSSEERTTTILIDNQGYISIDQIDPKWEEFLHARPRASNSLSFHMTQNGTATVRINDEIARNGIVFRTPVDRWSVVIYRQPQLTWYRIALFHR